ncbi:cation-transporting P-type ATPase [Chrysiogenes arsenatis]|uniref:cation-transporting P-type ATPase n=1 Tax=Chrysiogenes arsenatis TaxID=309797 RepID=UPI00042A33F1|nr:cation-transporting P-type ATPase [Chrysiogenes arsenatis]
MTHNPFHIENPHAREAHDVITSLQSSRTGLQSDEAAARLATVGPNRLPSPPKEGLFKRFFKHFHDVLIYILLLATLITALMGHWIDTGVILGVVVINAIIGFIQEGKAEEALEGIRNMLSLKAHVLRDGAWDEIDAAELVPGDIVRLRSGDRVPADMRLLDAVNLAIEESALTGESVPSDKTTHVAAPESGIGDRHGMAFSGTLVVAGRGLGVVSATGAATQIGHISTLIAEVETLETPLTKQMKQFGKVLSVAIVGMAFLMGFAGWFFHSYPLGDILLAAIGFTVAAIPEGLPAILTITLALGVQRMARRNAITRKLNAVETLGSVTVICSDKTGTLTCNEMTVRHVTTADHTYTISGTGYNPDGDITRNGHTVALDHAYDLHALIEVMDICNDTTLHEENGRWELVGEPTEGSLRTLGMKAAFNSAGVTRIDIIPFESENKFMATLNEFSHGHKKILLKGAPDRLLGRCSLQQCADHSTAPIDRPYWEEQINILSNQGLRVLAAAHRTVASETQTLTRHDIENDMIFLGIVGIIDPPRPEAIESIAACHRAGIRVIMITGDHAGTAKAIGREMGIGDGKYAITGSELEMASESELQALVRQNVIFARTSPEHKLRLVMALQANGDVVAMTGDGVNDAPALKRADVGIAMGIKGTEATKESAKIVLADDNFASIERAVEEGRTTYDNLRKAILFILPTNGAEGLVILAAVAFGFLLPLTPVQILWVNMVTAVTLALALAFEPSEPDVMQRPPRKPGASILDGVFLWRIAFVSSLIAGATFSVFVFEKHSGMPIELARTLAVNTLVFGQIFYLFNSRFLRESSMTLQRLFANRAAWISVVILLGLQLVFVYAPFMHTLFNSAPLKLQHWLIPFAIGLGVFLLVEFEKWVFRKVAKR